MTPLDPLPPGPSTHSPTDLPEALAFYAALGIPVTPGRPGDKAGYKKGWSAPGHCATVADFRLDDNIGILNGTEPTIDPGWFYHDVDIDENSDAARRIVQRLSPDTGWWYGRPSKPRSHCNFLVKGQLRTRQYRGIDGNVILELRGITQKRTHTLSVGPGSTHTSGEPIRFCEPRGAIGRVENPSDLDGAVQHAAVGIVLLQVWPASNHHNLRLAFSKVLIEHGVSPERTTAILEAVMEATGSNISDVAPAVRSTTEAMHAGAPTAGASVVVEVLGEEQGRAVLACIAKILRTSAVDAAGGVVMRGGDLTAIVNRAEEVLLSTPIYQRGGVLTRTIKLDTAIGDHHDVRREAGSTILAPVREPWLVEQMGRALRWLRVDAKGNVSPADPQAIYARTLLGRGEWRFPVLRGVVTAPTLARDGRIIETPGFDAASGLLVDITPGMFVAVPVAPTMDEAMTALARLARPFRAFPFVNDAARAVALSAMLTALVRPSLRTCPGHAGDSPTAGNGKTMLMEVPGLLATGFRPPALSQGKSDEEDEKRLSTILFAGDPVILIDNCERPVSGDFLCSMLTQEVVQARILGQSERRVLPSTALVLMTGNNLTFAGDMSRRVVVCRLDAGMERPDTRRFDFDCQAEILSCRPELVVAGLTILRAYHIAGRPERLTPMGSFNDWEWIRGALVWLGMADPADTRSSVLESDPRRDELLDVVQLWQDALGEIEVEVAEIASRGESVPAVKALYDKLVEVACRGAWNGKSVGWWLRRNQDRVVSGGRCFRHSAGRNGQRWRLAVVGGGLAAALPFEG
jgi:hypothetical protein